MTGVEGPTMSPLEEAKTHAGKAAGANLAAEFSTDFCAAMMWSLISIADSLTKIRDRT